MADTYTTNLNLTKPEPGAAEDTWGISLNADLDALDAIFSSSGTQINLNPNQVNFADNKKAIFGTGSDLQIFHDGSNSHLRDQGTGDILISASDKLIIRDTTDGSQVAVFDTDGAVSLNYGNSIKFATTSTGIDVTGTVTSDGLTVAGTSYIQSTTQPQLEIAYNSGNITGFYRSGGDFQIKNDNGVGTPETSIVLAEDGAVTLYHDASAKLATTSTGIDVTGTATADIFITANNNDNNTNKIGTIVSRQYDSGTETEGFLIAQTFANSSSNKLFIGGGTSQRNASTEISFYTASNATTRTGTERMRINNSGNVGIGTTSPSEKLTVDGIVKSNGFSTNTAGVSNFIAGVNAGSSIISGGEYNTLIGDEAGASITTGDFNVAVGNFALDANTTSSENTAIGYASLSNNITGARNVASGFRALQLNTASNDNTATGYFALYSTTGSNNTAIGKDAGKNITIGSKNTIIGSFNGNEGGLDIRTANNHIVLSDGDGNPRQVIDSSGNVGIGTTSPSSALDVTGDITLTGNVFTDGGFYGTRVWNEDATSLRFATNNTEVARFSSNGNFGIGTTSPNATLEVATSATTNIDVAHFSNSNGAVKAKFHLAAASGDGQLTLYDGNNNADVLISSVGNSYINSGGNVGVGTSSPNAKLHVSSTGDTILKITSADGNGAFLDLGDASDTDGGRIVYDSGSNLAFYTASTERARLDSSGRLVISNTNNFAAANADNVQIGNTSGSHGLTIVGQNTATSNIYFADNNNNDAGRIIYNHSDDSLKFITNRVEALRIDSSQRVGIGTSSPVKFLDVGANTNATAIDANIRLNTHYGTQNTARGGIQMFDGSGVTGQIDTRYDGNKVNMHFGSLYSGGYNTTSRMVITGDGKVGIGTTSPSTALHVSAPDGNAELILQRTGAVASSWGLKPYNSDLFIRENGTDKVTIKANGNVGLGTTTPDALLEINKGSEGEYLRVGGDNASNARSLRFTSSTASGTSVGALHTIKANSVGGEIAFANGNGNIMYLNVDRNVGIGTSSPARTTVINSSGTTTLQITNDTTGVTTTDGLQIKHYTSGATQIWNYENSYMAFGTNNAERARIDSSGNLLVGTTSTNPQSSSSVEGVQIAPDHIGIGRSGNTVLYLNRQSSDGTIISLRRDGATKAQIGILSASSGNDAYFSSGSSSTTGVGLRFIDVTTTNAILPCRGDGTTSDNLIDLGSTANRFDDIYATNGTIQTSDRNEKQDIQTLTDAEQRVATACKGLIRRYKFNRAVTEKGDDARYHFGIIAQDLQDAFEAEGLDAGDYGMFISSTWTDDDGNEQTRLGVRYNELLAFIITTL